MSINDGGPAFPEVFTDWKQKGDRDYHDTYSAGGMSLRDYFAAKALHRWLPGDLLMEGEKSGGVTRAAQLLTVSRNAYAVADAMLKARALPVGEGAGT